MSPLSTASILLCLVLLLGGCNQQAPSPEPTPLSAAESIEQTLEKARKHFSAQQFEESALAFRRALNAMEKAEVPEADITPVVEECALAMARAGGFLDSRKLWSDIKAKNSDSAENAERMVKRAEKMMLLQAEELTVQAAQDLKDGHRHCALGTIQAVIHLYTVLEGETELLAAAQKLRSKIAGTPLPEATTTPTPTG